MSHDGEKSGKRHTPRVWRLVLVVVLLLAGSIGLYVTVGRSDTRRRLHALHAAGYPTNFAELAEYTKLPEGVPNAAEVYTRAFAAFVPPANRANLPILGEAKLPGGRPPWPEPMAKAISECLAANGECLALLHEAAGIEHCRYDWDYADTLRLTTQYLPQVGFIVNCGRLLDLSTLFYASAGDTDAVVAGIRDWLRLGESMDREPGVCNGYLRRGLCGDAVRSLARALSVATFTDRQLTDLDRMLAASASALGLKETMVTERCLAIEEFRNQQRWNAPSLRDFPRWLLTVLKAPRTRRRSLDDLLDHLENCVAAADLPIVERMTRFREIEKRVGGGTWLLNLALSGDPRTRMDFTLARTALAIERHRLATGSLPEQLQELVPKYLEQAPLDLFNGQPIHYRRTPPGYLLYSVDKDGQDNGGRNPQDVQPGEPFDWCLLVTR